MVNNNGVNIGDGLNFVTYERPFKRREQAERTSTRIGRKSGRIFHNYFRILHISTKCKMSKIPSNCGRFFRNSCSSSQLVLFVYLLHSGAACLTVDGNTSHAAHYCRSLTDGTNHYAGVSWNRYSSF